MEPTKSHENSSRPPNSPTASLDYPSATPESEPGPVARPAGPTTGQRRLIAVLELLLCSSIPTQLAIGSALGWAGLAPMTANGELSFGFVVTLSLADTAALIALMVLVTHAHGESAAELWLGPRPIRSAALWKEFRYGLLLIPVVFLIVILLLSGLRAIAPWLHNVETNPLEQLAASSALNAAIFGLVAILAGGVREELQRAFLLRRFEVLGGPFVGVVSLSVAFGLGHYLQGWDAVITTGTLGAFWAIVYLRRGSAVAPVVSHAAFNSLEILRVSLGNL